MALLVHGAVSFVQGLIANDLSARVGLIAAIRRILVLTAEFSEFLSEGGDAFRNAMIELAVLTLLVLALVVALVLLRRRTAPPAADAGEHPSRAR